MGYLGDAFGAVLGDDDAPGDDLALGTESSFDQAHGWESTDTSGGGSGINWTSVITAGEQVTGSLIGAGVSVLTGGKTSTSTGTGGSSGGGGGGGSSGGGGFSVSPAVVGVGLLAAFLLLK